MGLWNMLGALVLLPALAHFLLPTTASAHPADSTSELFTEENPA